MWLYGGLQNRCPLKWIVGCPQLGGIFFLSIELGFVFLATFFFTRVRWSSKIGNNLCLSGFDWMTCNSSTVRVPFLLGFSTFGWWLLSECLKQLSCCHMISWSCVLWKWLLHAAQFTFLFILCAIFSLICIVIVLKDSPY